MIVAARWGTIAENVAGLGGLVTGLAAAFGVSAAYFRFRRSHEARLNVSVELAPTWLPLDGRQAIAVRVDVHNDGGREFEMLAGERGSGHPGSRIGVYVLGPDRPRVSDARPVRYVHWARQAVMGAPLIDEDSTLSAGDTWHADFAFVVSDDVRLARVVVELVLAQRPTLIRRTTKEVVSVATDTITGPGERSDHGPAAPPDAHGG